MRLGGVNDVMHQKRGLRILGIWEKSVSWVFASEEEGWLSELAEALRRVPHVRVGRWKSQHRKIVYLSPYVEKTFNSKVIKSFVPELRSRKCFCVSGFLCYLYMSYEHSKYVSHIHVWQCNSYSFSRYLETAGCTVWHWQQSPNKKISECFNVNLRADSCLYWWKPNTQSTSPCLEWSLGMVT